MIVDPDLAEQIRGLECPECGELDPDLFDDRDAETILGGDDLGYLRCLDCDAELEPTVEAALGMLELIAERFPELPRRRTIHPPNPARRYVHDRIAERGDPMTDTPQADRPAPLAELERMARRLARGPLFLCAAGDLEKCRLELDRLRLVEGVDHRADVAASPHVPPGLMLIVTAEARAILEDEGLDPADPGGYSYHLTPAPPPTATRPGRLGIVRARDAAEVVDDGSDPITEDGDR